MLQAVGSAMLPLHIVGPGHVVGVADRTWWLIGGMALFAAGVVAHAIRVRSRQELEEVLERTKDAEARAEERDARSEAVADNLLRLVMQHLCLSTRLQSDDDTISARASLYACTPAQRQRLVARVATNPKWAKHRNGATNLAPATGLVTDAWEHGSASADGLADPATHRDRWLAQQEETGLDAPTADSLDMPSRSYRLARLDSADARPAGVLVIESDHPHGIDGDGFDTMLDDPIRSLLASLLPMPDSVSSNRSQRVGAAAATDHFG